MDSQFLEQSWCFAFLLSIATVIRVFFRSRADAALEVLALRQRVAVLKRKRPRPLLTHLVLLFFWITLRNFWPRWSHVLLIVKRKLWSGWHRAGFRLFWRWRSRPRGGRLKLNDELRTLIRTMATEPTAQVVIASGGCGWHHAPAYQTGFSPARPTLQHFPFGKLGRAPYPHTRRTAAN